MLKVVILYENENERPDAVRIEELLLAAQVEDIEMELRNECVMEMT